MNVEEILKYKRPKENYYEIIGCHQSSSIDQISREYKIRALQLHPDKNPDPESLEKFRRLQAAKDILSDESSRKSYDAWLSSGINIPFEQWYSRKSHPMMHWAKPRSAKLSINESCSTRQGSEFKPVNQTNTEPPSNEWLDKFRKYEI